MNAPRSTPGLGLFRKPFFNFGRLDNSFWRDGIERSGADLGSGRNFARSEPFGLGFARKRLRAARIVSGLLVVRKMNRDIPRFTIVLDHDEPVTPMATFHGM